MRDHIRREAANLTASWWLVPVVFATAALVAMATIDPEAQGQQAAPQRAAMPTVTQPAAPPEPGILEVTEHVQAF